MEYWFVVVGMVLGVIVAVVVEEGEEVGVIDWGKKS